MADPTPTPSEIFEDTLAESLRRRASQAIDVASGRISEIGPAPAPFARNPEDPGPPLPAATAPQAAPTPTVIEPPPPGTPEYMAKFEARHQALKDYLAGNLQGPEARLPPNLVDPPSTGRPQLTSDIPLSNAAREAVLYAQRVEAGLDPKTGRAATLDSVEPQVENALQGLDSYGNADPNEKTLSEAFAKAEAEQDEPALTDWLWERNPAVRFASWAGDALHSLWTGEDSVEEPDPRTATDESAQDVRAQTAAAGTVIKKLRDEKTGAMFRQDVTAEERAWWKEREAWIKDYLKLDPGTRKTLGLPAEYNLLAGGFRAGQESAVDLSRLRQDAIISETGLVARENPGIDPEAARAQAIETVDKKLVQAFDPGGPLRGLPAVTMDSDWWFLSGVAKASSDLAETINGVRTEGWYRAAETPYKAAKALGLSSETAEMVVKAGVGVPYVLGTTSLLGAEYAASFVGALLPQVSHRTLGELSHTQLTMEGPLGYLFRVVDPLNPLGAMVVTGTGPGSAEAQAYLQEGGTIFEAFPEMYDTYANYMVNPALELLWSLSGYIPSDTAQTALRTAGLFAASGISSTLIRQLTPGGEAPVSEMEKAPDIRDIVLSKTIAGGFMAAPLILASPDALSSGVAASLKGLRAGWKAAVASEGLPGKVAAAVSKTAFGHFVQDANVLYLREIERAIRQEETAKGRQLTAAELEPHLKELRKIPGIGSVIVQRFAAESENDVLRRMRDGVGEEDRQLEELASRAHSVRMEEELPEQLAEFREMLRATGRIPRDDPEGVIETLTQLTAARAFAWAKKEGLPPSEWPGWKGINIVGDTWQQWSEAAEEAATLSREGPEVLQQFRGESAGVPEDASPEVLEEAARLWRELGTESPYFKEWFEGSQAVDESGKPLVVYHGTGAAFETFETSGREGRTIYGEGSYFSESPEVAKLYASGATPRIIPTYLSIKNPFIRGRSVPGDAAKAVIRDYLERQGRVNWAIDEPYIRGKMASFSTGWDTLEEVIPPGVLTAALRADGFDGVRVGTDWVAFDPTQIKSAHNRGTFDPTDARILRQEGDTESPHFKRWFGGSKVVDKAGKPLVVYHGGGDVEGGSGSFRVSRRGALGRGIYFTPSRARATEYAIDFATETDTPGTIFDGYVSIKNPLILGDQPGHPMINGFVKLGMDKKRAIRLVERVEEQHGYIGSELQNAAKKQGYDGIIQYEGPGKGISEVVAFDPTQIKSVRNRGTFDPADPRVLRQEGELAPSKEAATQDLIREADAESAQELRRVIQDLPEEDIDPKVLQQTLEGRRVPKGQVEFAEDGKATIRAFQSADFSTFVHELGHVFRRELDTEDMGTLTEWAKSQGIEISIDDAGQWVGSDEARVAAEELFARGFERYLADGYTPIKALKDVFRKIRDMMVGIYRAISDSDIDLEIPREMRLVYDRLLDYDTVLDDTAVHDVLDISPLTKLARALVAQKVLERETKRGEGGARLAELATRKRREKWLQELVESEIGARAELKAVNKALDEAIREALEAHGVGSTLDYVPIERRISKGTYTVQGDEGAVQVHGQDLQEVAHYLARSGETEGLLIKSAKLQKYADLLGVVPDRKARRDLTSMELFKRVKEAFSTARRADMGKLLSSEEEALALRLLQAIPAKITRRRLLLDRLKDFARTHDLLPEDEIAALSDDEKALSASIRTLQRATEKRIVLGHGVESVSQLDPVLTTASSTAQDLTEGSLLAIEKSRRKLHIITREDFENLKGLRERLADPEFKAWGDVPVENALEAVGLDLKDYLQDGQWQKAKLVQAVDKTLSQVVERPGVKLADILQLNNEYLGVQRTLDRIKALPETMGVARITSKEKEKAFANEISTETARQRAETELLTEIQGLDKKVVEAVSSLFLDKGLQDLWKNLTLLVSNPETKTLSISAVQRVLREAKKLSFETAVNTAKEAEASLEAARNAFKVFGATTAGTFYRRTEFTPEVIQDARASMHAEARAAKETLEKLLEIWPGSRNFEVPEHQAAMAKLFGKAIAAQLLRRDSARAMVAVLDTIDLETMSAADIKKTLRTNAEVLKSWTGAAVKTSQKDIREARVAFLRFRSAEITEMEEALLGVARKSQEVLISKSAARKAKEIAGGLRLRDAKKEFTDRAVALRKQINETAKNSGERVKKVLSLLQAQHKQTRKIRKAVLARQALRGSRSKLLLDILEDTRNQHKVAREYLDNRPQGDALLLAIRRTRNKEGERVWAIDIPKAVDTLTRGYSKNVIRAYLEKVGEDSPLGQLLKNQGQHIGVREFSPTAYSFLKKEFDEFYTFANTAGRLDPSLVYGTQSILAADDIFIKRPSGPIARILAFVRKLNNPSQEVAGQFSEELINLWKGAHNLKDLILTDLTNLRRQFQADAPAEILRFLDSNDAIEFNVGGQLVSGANLAARSLNYVSRRPGRVTTISNRNRNHWQSFRDFVLMNPKLAKDEKNIGILHAVSKAFMPDNALVRGEPRVVAEFVDGVYQWIEENPTSDLQGFFEFLRGKSVTTFGESPNRSVRSFALFAEAIAFGSALHRLVEDAGRLYKTHIPASVLDDVNKALLGVDGGMTHLEDIDAAFQALAGVGKSTVSSEMKLIDPVSGRPQPTIIQFEKMASRTEGVVLPRHLLTELASRIIIKSDEMYPAQVDKPLVSRALHAIGFDRMRQYIMYGGLAFRQAHATALQIGDFGSIGMLLGWSTAAKVAFNMLPLNIPYGGLALQKYIGLAADGQPTKGRLRLPPFSTTQTNSVLQRILSGDPTLDTVTLGGVDVRVDDLVDEFIREGVTDTAVQAEFAETSRKTFEAQYRGYLNDEIVSAEIVGDRGKVLFFKDLLANRMDQIMLYAEEIQRRQRMFLYTTLRDQGHSATDAGRLTREALLDYSHGITRQEMTSSITRLAMFYRWWRLATTQTARVIADPFLDPNYLDKIREGTAAFPRLVDQVNFSYQFPQIATDLMDEEESEEMQSQLRWQRMFYPKASGDGRFRIGAPLTQRERIDLESTGRGVVDTYSMSIAAFQPVEVLRILLDPVLATGHMIDALIDPEKTIDPRIGEALFDDLMDVLSAPYFHAIAKDDQFTFPWKITPSQLAFFEKMPWLNTMVTYPKGVPHAPGWAVFAMKSMWANFALGSGPKFYDTYFQQPQSRDAAHKIAVAMAGAYGVNITYENKPEDLKKILQEIEDEFRKQKRAHDQQFEPRPYPTDRSPLAPRGGFGPSIEPLLPPEE